MEKFPRGVIHQHLTPQARLLRRVLLVPIHRMCRDIGRVIRGACLVLQGRRDLYARYIPQAGM